LLDATQGVCVFTVRPDLFYWRRCALVFIASVAFCDGASADVINVGTREWADAARVGRADMLILGDSMVAHEGYGWDGGFNDAFTKNLGIAGSGLISGNSGVDGQGFAIGAFYGSPWSSDPAAVPANRQGYVWRGAASTIGPNATGQYFASISGSTLRSTTGYDWNLYTASPPGGGSLSASSRLASPPYTTINTLGPVAIATPAAGLDKVSLHFDAPGSDTELDLQNTSNTSILYSRVSAPGQTGVTVTSWGYGGASTLRFLTDQWNGQGMTAEGRTAWFNALTDGGSGKLNVLLAEGLNDRNERLPSAHGITPGYSTAAFMDNLTTLIAEIRNSWAAAGHAPSDLSFTLLGSYHEGYEGDSYGPLRDFAAAEAQLALSDPSISAIDLGARGISYDQAVANGWMVDEVHASISGTQAYAQIVADALVPEPACLSVVLLGFGLLRRRSRSANLRA
jgi:hypothetical protein